MQKKRRNNAAVSSLYLEAKASGAMQRLPAASPQRSATFKSNASVPEDTKKNADGRHFVSVNLGMFCNVPGIRYKTVLHSSPARQADRYLAS